MKHLDIGGSTASRTGNCPGWLRESKGRPRAPISEATIEGSLHHEVQEACRLHDKHPEDFIGFTYAEGPFDRTFTEEDLPLSLKAYHAVDALMVEYDIDEYVIEPFVQIIPDIAGGSIDFLGLSKDRKTVLSIDYKFGRVAVQAESNQQQVFYKIAAKTDPLTADLFEEAQNFVCVIIQPRDGEPKKWTFSLDELLSFETQWVEKLRIAQAPDAPLKAGSWCAFCPSGPFCETRRTHAMAAALLKPEDKLELQAAADLLEEVDAWVKDVKAALYMYMSRGASIEGYKLVAKRATRKWDDVGGLEKALTDAGLQVNDFTKTEVLSPAQLDPVLRKSGISLDTEPFVKRVSSGNTIAVSSSKEPAVQPDNVSAQFADVMNTLDKGPVNK